MSTTVAPTPPTTEPADLRGYRAIHLALREGAHAMAAAAPRLGLSDGRRVAAFARDWKGYRGEVLAHHGGEDRIVFPAAVARVPELAAVLVRTEAEHHELDEVMDDISETLAGFQPGDDPARLTGLLRHLSDHMDAHLALEDAEILPLIDAAFDRDAWAVVEKAVTDDLGVGAQAVFTIPFIGVALDPAERAALLADAPAPFRVIHRLFAGRHARLRALALDV